MYLYIYMYILYRQWQAHVYIFIITYTSAVYIYIYIQICVRAHAVPIYQVNSSKLAIHEGIGPHSHLPLPGAQGIRVSFLNLLSKWTWKNMISPETICNIWRGGFILVHWKDVFVLWYEIVIQNDLPLHLAQPGCHPARELSKMLLSSVSSVFLQLKIKSSVPSSPEKLAPSIRSSGLKKDIPEVVSINACSIYFDILPSENRNMAIVDAI